MKKRKDGRYRKAITDPRTGKRVYFYGETEREINKKIIEYQSQAERGRLFSEIAEAWWADKLETMTAGTKRGYSAAYKRALQWFGKMPVKDIKPKDVEKYLRDLAKQGYTTKSIRNDKLVLNLILDIAVVEGDILYNPCISITIPKGKASTARTAASEEDERKIMDTSDLWLFPFLALMTGMRKGECLALQWGDVDLETNLIHVNKSVEHLGSRAHIKSTKTENGNRSIVILPPLREALLKLPKKAKTDFVLSEDGGKTPLSAKQYNRLWRDYRAATGITCTAHQLRHSFATMCFEAGLPDKVVQHMIGHANISTTKDIYTDLRPGMLEQANAILTEYLGKKNG